MKRRFNQLQETTHPTFAGHTNEAHETDPELRDGDGSFTPRFDPGPPPRIFLERGQPHTVDHFVFRVTLNKSPYVHGNYQPISAADIVRIDVLTNPLRAAQRKAEKALWDALYAGRLPRVMQAQFEVLTGLPAQAFDKLTDDPHGPEIHTDEQGFRYVTGPQFLTWLDSIRRDGKAGKS